MPPLEAQILPRSPRTRLESTLTAKQSALFRKRLEEGYDIVIEDLSSLSSEQRKEYLLWVSWKGLNPPLQSVCVNDGTLEVHSYYAVYFSRRSRGILYWMTTERCQRDGGQLQVPGESR